MRLVHSSTQPNSPPPTTWQAIHKEYLAFCERIRTIAAEGGEPAAIAYAREMTAASEDFDELI